MMAPLISLLSLSLPFTGSEGINERIRRHSAGEVPSTADRLPTVLVKYIAFTDKYKAFEFEKYLKGGSGRAFLNKRLFDLQNKYLQNAEVSEWQSTT